MLLLTVTIKCHYLITNYFWKTLLLQRLKTGSFFISIMLYLNYRLLILKGHVHLLVHGLFLLANIRTYVL